jgi:S1-C subfamily serine protease
MTRIIFLVLPSLLMAACQSFQTNGATREEKSAALQRHLVEWQPETLVNQFTAPRTTQLFAGLTLIPGTNRVTAESTGLAALLTADGYALTATHVLKDRPGTILRLKSPRPGKLMLTDAGPVFAPSGRPDEVTRVPNRSLEVVPVRVVHRFPGADLTLLHLPIRPTATFRLATRPPDRDSTVFGSGSSLSGSASAGRILRTSQRSQTWKLTTSIPLQRGDSGGPVMNPAGQLVGIISRGQTRPFSSQLTATVANGVSPGTLRALIARDRAR